jgi:predicted DNA-binding transcriptional regulator AlpA
MAPLKLYGRAEVAEALGLRPTAVHHHAAKPDFPEPVAHLKAGPVWDGNEIDKWAATASRDQRRSQDAPQ